MSSRGTYVLVVDLPRATTLEVGALGEREFDPGSYAYVGSAFGHGGFARVDRRRSELRRGLPHVARENATGISTICSNTPRRPSSPRSRSPTSTASAN